MTRVLTFAATTATGTREQNEDRWFADGQAGLFVVSDGVGGAVRGELAAQTVVDSLPEYLAAARRSNTSPIEPEAWLGVALDWLGTAVGQLSDELYARGQRDAEVAGTGATIVAALIKGKDCVIAHLGDSPAYLLHNGQLTGLTTDHTLARVLQDAGAITADDALQHPGRNKLTRYFGMNPPAHPAVTGVELADGDRLLLCTDGINGVLDDDTIRAILGSGGSPETVCATLIGEATNAQSRDNMTALVVDF